MTSIAPSTATRTAGPFAALLLAVLSFSLLQTLVVPALPQLQQDFGADPLTASWVISIFLVTSSVGTVILGRLGDLFGRKRMLLLSLGFLGIGSVVAALSPSIAVLIVARGIQGLGAGTFPLAFGLVREAFPREKVPVAIGTISAVFGIGFGIGLIAPGPLIDAFGWPSLFWSSFILVAVAALAVAMFIAASSPSVRGRIDGVGALLLTVTLVTLLLAISQSRSWGALPTTALIIVSAVTLTGFLLLERKTAQPLMNLGILRRRPIVAANLAALIIGFGMYSAFTLVPQLMQTPLEAGYGFGATVSEAGLYLLPMAITMLFAGPTAGRIGPRIGYTPMLVIACLIGAVGFAVIAIGDRQGWAIATGAGIIGLGIGFAFSSLANVVIAAVEPHETGETTGVNTILRTIGGAIGAQTAAAIVTSQTIPGTGFPEPSMYTIAFAVSSIALGAAGLAALLGGTRRRHAPRER